MCLCVYLSPAVSDRKAATVNAPAKTARLNTAMMKDQMGWLVESSTGAPYLNNHVINNLSQWKIDVFCWLYDSSLLMLLLALHSVLTFNITL